MLDQGRYEHIDDRSARRRCRPRHAEPARPVERGQRRAPRRAGPAAARVRRRRRRPRARHHRRRPGVLRRRRLQPDGRRLQRPGDHAGGGPPDRRPPPGVLEAGHLGGQRLRDGTRRHRGPARRRRLRGALGGVRRHPRRDGHRRRRRRPGHLAAADGRQPGQVLPDDRRAPPGRGGRAARARQLRRRRRRRRRRGDGAGEPPRGRSGAGDLGVEDGDQRLHADGVEPRAAAVAGLEGRTMAPPTTARP